MIQKYNIQSMACLPTLSQGELKAMIYLENRQTADVFTLENVGILKHLSAQFVVSVENALLYDSLNQLVEERTFDLQKKIVENKRTEEHLQQEVAERKTAERELQSQIILLDSMLDTTMDTIEIFNPDTLV
jgi:GAF domain-containing protein